MRLDDDTERLSLELRDELAAPDVRRLVDPRSLPVRFSRLRQFARSGAHYFAACQEDDGDTLARKLGRGAHALVLGQPVAVWDGHTATGRAKPRNGNAWEAFKAKHANAEILNAKEYAQASAIASAVTRHPRVSQMLESPTLLEAEIDWTYMGRRCQSHLDMYMPGAFIADLKAVRDGKPDRFARTALQSCYHAQLAFYVTAAESKGDEIRDAFLIPVENVRPFPVTVMPLHPDVLTAGRKQFHLWFEDLLRCEEAGVWPEYSEVDVMINMPSDGMERYLGFMSADDQGGDET